MTEYRAIRIIESTNFLTNTSDVMEAIEIAKVALEKQEKIKEVFTHYAFSGNEFDVFNDCISALSEIKAILKEE